MNVLIAYDRCSTCKRAEDFLKAQGVSFQKRPIKEENPTAKEIHEMRERSGLPLKRFFNTSGLKYRELGLKEKVPHLSAQEAADLLSTDGMLIKRPLLVQDNQILQIGYRKAYEELGL